MASHRGPRRTRVYDANYNIGQSYYKSALDDLDRKYHGRVDSAPTITPRVNFDLEDRFDNDLSSARSRASKVITDESVFDSRGMRSLKGAPLSSAFDDEIDDDVKSSLSRIRANKSKIASAINEFDLDDSYTSSSMRKRGDSAASKFLDLAGDDDIRSKVRSRSLLKSRAEDDSNISSSVSSSFKRFAISDKSESVNSGASMRAQASMARLADIESDMFQRSEKQLEREKRSANLKKILADNDIESVSKHVSF